MSERARIPGVPTASPLGEAVEDYFEALAEGDYRTARMCLTSILRESSNPQVVERLLRLTHEQGKS